MYKDNVYNVPSSDWIRNLCQKYFRYWLICFKSLACLFLPWELRLVSLSTLCPWNTCSTVWCKNDLFAWRHHTRDKYTYPVLELKQFNEVISLSKCYKLWLPVLHENFTLIQALCSFCIKLVPTTNLLVVFINVFVNWLHL